MLPYDPVRRSEHKISGVLAEGNSKSELQGFMEKSVGQILSVVTEEQYLKCSKSKIFPLHQNRIILLKNSISLNPALRWDICKYLNIKKIWHDDLMIWKPEFCAADTCEAGWVSYNISSSETAIMKQSAALVSYPYLTCIPDICSLFQIDSISSLPHWEENSTSWFLFGFCRRWWLINEVCPLSAVSHKAGGPCRDWLLARPGTWHPAPSPPLPPPSSPHKWCADPPPPLLY